MNEALKTPDSQSKILNHYAGYELAYARIGGCWVVRLSKCGLIEEMTLGPTLLWADSLAPDGLSETARRAVTQLKYRLDEAIRRREVAA